MYNPQTAHKCFVNEYHRERRLMNAEHKSQVQADRDREHVKIIRAAIRRTSASDFLKELEHA
jgi:hypothetical protein